MIRHRHATLFQLTVDVLFGGPTPAGAVLTPAFGLGPRVRHIVHAVGPRYGVDEPASELLASAYQASAKALLSADTALRRCLLVAFDERTRKFWERALPA